MNPTDGRICILTFGIRKDSTSVEIPGPNRELKYYLLFLFVILLFDTYHGLPNLLPEHQGCSSLDILGIASRVCQDS